MLSHDLSLKFVYIPSNGQKLPVTDLTIVVYLPVAQDLSLNSNIVCIQQIESNTNKYKKQLKIEELSRDGIGSKSIEKRLAGTNDNMQPYTTFCGNPACCLKI